MDKGHDAIEVKSPKCGNLGAIAQEAWNSNGVVFKKPNESKCMVQSIEMTDPYFVKPSKLDGKPHEKPDFKPEKPGFGFKPQEKPDFKPHKITAEEQRKIEAEKAEIAKKMEKHVFTPEELKNIEHKKELLAKNGLLDTEKLEKNDKLEKKDDKATWQEREIIMLKKELAELKKELEAARLNARRLDKHPKPYVLKGAEEKVY